MRPHIPLLVAVVVLATAAPAAAQDPTPLVVVEGASVRAVPDTATVAGEITRRARTAAIARTTELSKPSQILAAFGGASISGPEFEVSDTTAARQEATRIALQRARLGADAAAAALGMRVLAIRKVDLNAEFGYDAAPQPASGGPGGGTDESAGGGGGVSIEPGREQVSVVVAVVYELGP
jgi:uncharacterized protein YggE